MDHYGAGVVMTAAENTALVLSGGGVYGAFEVGVMKALFGGASPVTGYQPLDAGIFCGTSIGAFNAACMVGCTAATNLEAALRLENIWVQDVAQRPGACGSGALRIRGLSEYSNVDCYRQPAALAGRFARDSVALSRYVIGRTANFLAASGSLVDRITSLVNLESFVDQKVFQELVNRSFREEDILHAAKRLNLVATNWSTGQSEFFMNTDFLNGRGYKCVMASAALPGVFPPVEIEGDNYVDGGVTENTPLNTAIKDGATELHVVYLNPEPQFIPLKGQPDTLDTMLRVFYLMLAGKIQRDIVTAGWINDGLKAMEQFQAEGQVPASAALAFARISSKLLHGAYHAVTIHQYYPKTPLGGEFGMVDNRLTAVEKLIREGENVALTHDCGESQCLLPS